MTPVKLKPAASRSRVKHSTTEPLRCLFLHVDSEDSDQKGKFYVFAKFTGIFFSFVMEHSQGKGR